MLDNMQRPHTPKEKKNRYFEAKRKNKNFNIITRLSVKKFSHSVLQTRGEKLLVLPFIKVTSILI